jgi:hypothetical protein
MRLLFLKLQKIPVVAVTVTVHPLCGLMFKPKADA